MSTTTQTQASTTFPLRTTFSHEDANFVTAPLNFSVLPTDGSKAYSYVEKAPEGEPQTNLGVAAHEVRIHDIRGNESAFSIDHQAFLPIKANDLTRSSKADFTSDETTRSTYYAEVERLLLETLPGAPNRVIIFDHTIRRAVADANRGPVLRTHIDQTPPSARERVRLHASSPEEADELLKHRVRLVNVWRPLNGPVETSPLAVADSSTIPDSDIVGVEHRYPHRTGETAAISFNPGTKWWYWSGMDNDERLLLQCYDSETGTRVPHTAFNLPDEEGKKHRESIEVRALIFG